MFGIFFDMYFVYAIQSCIKGLKSLDFVIKLSLLVYLNSV